MTDIYINGDDGGGYTVEIQEAGLPWAIESCQSAAEVFDLLGGIDGRACPKVFAFGHEDPDDLDDWLDYFGREAGYDI